MGKMIHNDSWIKASAAGSLWAAFEIVVGSLLHNLHFPFTGIVMASIGVVLLTSLSVLWQAKDLFLKAGLVCALMKSISPSAVILGPMMGIMLESFMMQLFIWIFGRNIFGYAFAGVFALLSLLIHKVAGLMISYGFDLVTILENTVAFIFKTFSITTLKPVSLLYFYAGILVFFGIISSLSGYCIGLKAKKSKIKYSPVTQSSGQNTRKYSEIKAKGIWLLISAIVFIVYGMFFISTSGLFHSAIYVVVFIASAALMYPSEVKRLCKPSVFMNFAILIAFSVFFFDYKNSGIRWSDAGLIVGIKMSFRALLILVGFTLISIELKNPIVRKFLNEKSLVYESINSGFSILPSLIKGLPNFKEFMANPFTAFSLRIAQVDLYIKNGLKDESDNT